jgi:hypothetical protein
VLEMLLVSFEAHSFPKKDAFKSITLFDRTRDYKARFRKVAVDYLRQRGDGVHSRQETLPLARTGQAETELRALDAGIHVPGLPSGSHHEGK